MLRVSRTPMNNATSSMIPKKDRNTHQRVEEPTRRPPGPSRGTRARTAALRRASRTRRRRVTRRPRACVPENIPPAAPAAHRTPRASRRGSPRADSRRPPLRREPPYRRRSPTRQSGRAREISSGCSDDSNFGKDYRGQRPPIRIRTCPATSSTFTFTASTPSSTAPIACRSSASASAELGMSAVAVTDHGNMFGAFDFYHEALQQRRAPDPRRRGVHRARRSARPRGPGRERVGRGLRLPSDASRRDSDRLPESRAPRVRGLSDGLLPPAADGQGAPARALRGSHRPVGMPQGRGGRIALARQLRRPPSAAFLEYEDIFGKGNFYVEIMDHGLPQQTAILPELLRLSRRPALPPSPPTTATTCAATTRSPTRCSSASGWARRSRTSGGCGSTTTSSTSRAPTR